MKNYLLSLLLIFSIATQAQTYQNPTFGKLTLKTNTLSTSTARINTQDTITGQVNYINALSLPVPTSVINAIKQKSDLSTGLIKNGLISANGDPTKFNITAGIGIISNFDDPENPISTIINFPAFNSITPTYLNTGNITYVAINSTPAVVMQATPFTPEQRRSLIVLGATIHSNLTTINVLNNISAPTNADTNQLHDFMEAVGALNITGNKYTANGANLQLNKSAGVLFKLGSNFAVDWKNPHEIAQTGGTAITFRYRTQNGTESADMTSISPGLYDLNNVLTTVPNNKFTIQTVTVFQTGLTRIQWGQTIYDDLQSAKNALLTRDYVVENNIKENGVTRAYIIVRNSTTSLQNVSDAYISEAQKFGGVASGGVALTLSSIVTALGYTPENIANKSDSFTVSSSTTYSSTKALVDGLATKQNTLTNPITGTGSTNTIPKFTGTNTLGDGSIRDNVNVSIGTGGFSNKLTLYSAANEYALRVGQNTTNVTGSYTGITFFNSTNTGGTGTSTGTASLKITRMPNNLQGNLAFLIGTTQVGMFDDYGHLLIATPSSNGIDALQTPLTISHAAGITANQGVIKSQLDLKADISNSVLLTGDQTLSGVKTIARTNVNLSSFRMFNNSSTSIAIENNNSDGIFRQSVNSSTGTHNRLYNESSGVANSNKNSSTGKFNINLNDINTGIFNDNSNTGSGIFNKNTNSGTGVFNDSFNISTGFFDKRRNDSTGILNYYDSNAGSTGDLQQYLKNGILTSKINHLGELTSPKITMTGTIELKSYTVATLPTGVQGATAYVTDALAPSYLGTLTGGGTVKAPVFYDGTVWRSTINSIDTSDIVYKTGIQTITGLKIFTENVYATGFVKTGGTAAQFLKADGSVDESDVVKNIAKDATQGANVTGTVSETILYSKLIPANTFKDGDFMNLFSRVSKAGVLGTLTQRVRTNTSNTLTGSILIASNLMVTSNQVGNLYRYFTVSNGFLTGISSGTSSNDLINTNALSQFNVFDPTVDNYIFITGQLSNALDTMFNLGTKITN